jgi:uncharacterized protein (UPF0261 family)
MSIVLVGTLDTKGREYAWLRDRLRGHGSEVLLVDTGVLDADHELPVEVSAAEVADAAGSELGALREAADRGRAVEAMGRGAATIVRRLYEQGRLDAVLAVGGSGGASIAAQAMQSLPVGVPKLLVSTMASGDVSAYVGTSDVTLMYSVTDVAGLNRISRRVLGNAAAAVAGMASAPAAPHEEDERPLVAASMFGVTTLAVNTARQRLEELGYDVLVFHATGAGGRTLESLAASGMLAGVLDLTTTELVDEHVGGVLSAGSDRLEAAGRAGIPQVVSLGALDMCNFGPRDTVPPRFVDRNLLVHNPQVTLMRTTAGEMAEVCRTIATKLARATGPTSLYVPLRGVSAVDLPGQPFHDPGADESAFTALRDTLHTQHSVEYRELDMHINDPEFALAMADRLHELIRTQHASAITETGT